MKRFIKHALVLAAAFGITLSTATMASATYFFEPGQPTFFGGPDNINDYCTGGYAIRGTSGMFILTTGLCTNGAVGVTVYGTDAAFADVAYTHFPQWDTSLISEWPGNDAYQIVVDPFTGQTPGTHGGKVVGIYPKSSLTAGTLIGKMGRTTGWQEGVIFGTITWSGFTAYCTHANTDVGDSGGPVWRTDSNGDVLAVGITVAYDPNTGDGCFVAIQDILDNWGAWLPVFGPSVKSANARPATPMRTGTAGPVQVLDPKQFIPAVGTR